MENFYNYNFCFNYLQDEVKYLKVNKNFYFKFLIQTTKLLK